MDLQCIHCILSFVTVYGHNYWFSSFLDKMGCFYHVWLHTMVELILLQTGWDLFVKNEVVNWEYESGAGCSEFFRPCILTSKNYISNLCASTSDIHLQLLAYLASAGHPQTRQVVFPLSFCFPILIIKSKISPFFYFHMFIIFSYFCCFCKGNVQLWGLFLS